MAGGQGTQHDTRLRVLESAVEVFAARGFRDATIHGICEGAEANIAAVNYYFGAKQALHGAAIETLQHLPWNHTSAAARLTEVLDSCGQHFKHNPSRRPFHGGIPARPVLRRY